MNEQINDLLNTKLYSIVSLWHKQNPNQKPNKTREVRTKPEKSDIRNTSIALKNKIKLIYKIVEINFQLKF